MLSRSFSLLRRSTPLIGFAAFQKKVEDGHGKPLVSAQLHTLKTFYRASKAVAHLPSVLHVARALMSSQGEKGGGGISSKHVNTTAAAVAAANAANSQQHSTTTTTTAITAKRNSLSSPAVVKRKPLARALLRPKRKSSAVKAGQVKSTEKGNGKKVKQLALLRKRTARLEKSKALALRKQQQMELLKKKKQMMAEKIRQEKEKAKEKQRQVILKRRESQERKQFSQFRRSVLTQTGLPTNSRLEERMRQLWNLMESRKFRRERRISLAVRVLRPSAMKAKSVGVKSPHSPHQAAGSVARSRISNTGRSQSPRIRKLAVTHRSPPRGAHKGGITALPRAREPVAFSQFAKAVLDKTGLPHSRETQRRVSRLWRLMLNKDITFQQRVAVALRVLEPVVKRTARSGAGIKKQKSLNGGRSRSSVTGTASSRVGRGRRALIGSAASIASPTSATSMYSKPPSKKELDKQQFLQFRKAVLTGSRAPATPQIEKGLKGVWRMLATKRMTFEQRVAVATRMLVQSLERAALASKEAAARAKATQKTLLKKSRQAKKKSVSQRRGRAASSKSASKKHRASKKPSITRSADGSRIYVAPPPVSSSLGSSGMGSSQLPRSPRQQLNKKQIDFLAFYRAMLLTGQISRDPAERSRTIKYLWANTRHLKKVEQRIKLAEAYLAGAIPFPSSMSSTPSGEATSSSASPLIGGNSGVTGTSFHSNSGASTGANTSAAAGVPFSNPATMPFSGTGNSHNSNTPK